MHLHHRFKYLPIPQVKPKQCFLACAYEVGQKRFEHQCRLHMSWMDRPSFGHLYLSRRHLICWDVWWFQNDLAVLAWAWIQYYLDPSTAARRLHNCWHERKIQSLLAIGRAQISIPNLQKLANASRCRWWWVVVLLKETWKFSKFPDHEIHCQWRLNLLCHNKPSAFKNATQKWKSTRNRSILSSDSAIPLRRVDKRLDLCEALVASDRGRRSANQSVGVQPKRDKRSHSVANEWSLCRRDPSSCFPPKW